MDSDDSEDDSKINVCPICYRDFTTVAGLNLHVTKGHTEKEIQEAIKKNTRTPPPTNESTPAPTSSRSWNKLQILNNDINKQFDILENDAGGDCLFLSLIEFLNNYRSTFKNVPSDANELRKTAVNYLLSHDINRFKDSIITNLANEIPGLVSNDSNDGTSGFSEENYSRYMCTQGNYGTVVELCALAELFGFDFYVIRQNSPSEYICYDYGSVCTVTAESVTMKRTVHLLFTGNIHTGHFRLLNPTTGSHCLNITLGNYHLVKDYTSSRLTSIAHASTVAQSSDQLDTSYDQVEGNGNESSSKFTCNVCSRPFQSQRGLNIHRHCHDNSSPTSSQTKQDDVVIPATTLEDFVNLLAQCKKNIKVLKRIPRAARVSAAKSLAKSVDECLAQPHSDKPWMKLLTLAYTSLQVPDKVRNVSLTTLVKRNVANPTLVFKRRMKNKTPISISRRIEYKIAEGDVKGAVKILSSNDTLAPQNLDTLNKLRLKHPPPACDPSFPEPPEKNSEHLVVSEKDVVRNINNFTNGSASGIDGILPQHLKDLTAPQTGEAGLKLIKSITNLSNFMLAGKIPNKLRAIMYGASLCALNKEEGGIRPIAVGNTFRRITAKLASASVRSEMSSEFAPRQVATRTFIKRNRHRAAVVLKIDFRNAFNELDRGKFLGEMKAKCPLIFPFLWQCYATSSLLFFGDDIILSENGAQQGDPCGPLLFCSAIQAVVAALISEFVVFYLDDGTIAGSYDGVLGDFETIIRECGKIGVHINPTKCELFFCSEVDPDVVSQFEEISPGIIIVNELTLLGAPITDNAFLNVFRKKLRQLGLLFGRLVDLDNYQIAYYLLGNCLSIPKLVFLLRTSPVWNHMDLVVEIDNCIKSTLETLTNSKLNHKEWIMSSLPIRCGGLGVRRVQDLALPAYLSSVNGVSSMISIMLNQPSLNIVDISDYENGINAWQQLNPEDSLPESLHSQKQWDSIQVNRLINGLQYDNEEDVARMLAIQKPEAGAWLHALPSRTLGTLLENNVFRIMVGLRLGLDICTPHRCVCGDWVNSKGRHGLKCKNSAGRWSRHSELNNIIKRALATTDIPARLEPPGLFRDDGKKVDGISLIPWHKGQTLVWDATCTDTFAPSNLKYSAVVAGRAADDKARRKELKYQSLIDRNYHFVPFAVETMGPWGADAKSFFNALGKLIVLKTEDPRSKAFLQQRISIAIQKGNAAAVMGCFQPEENLEVVFYL